MQSVIFGTFSLKKYLLHMGWRKIPDNHWTNGLDGEIAMFDGERWKCMDYTIEERWLA